jgi:SAM-dependent methyltransferase
MMARRSASPRSPVRRADRTIRTGRGTEGFYRRVFGATLVERPGRTLDAGAGDSPYGAGRHAVVRIDPAYRHDPPGVPANCLAAVCEALPFRDGAFDTVLASFVVQHAADPGLCLTELLRVCSASGIVAVFPLWRPRRLAVVADSLLAGYAQRRPVPGMMDALTIRRPGDADVRALGSCVAATGALGPPRFVAWGARLGMSAIVRVHGTTQFRVIRRRRPPAGSVAPDETAATARKTR